MKSWLPAIFWAILIFSVSSIPSLKVTNDSFLQNLINNFGHFTEYAIFAYLIFRPLYFYYHLTPPKLFQLNFILPFLYSLTDEFHQHFVPGRMMDIRDVMVDVLGISLTLFLISRNKPTHSNKPE